MRSSPRPLKRAIKALGIFVAGVAVGYLAAPLHADPMYPQARYKLAQNTYNPMPPPYTLAPQAKLWKITCISEAEKDCEQTEPTPIPTPGTLSLMIPALLALGFVYGKPRSRPSPTTSR